MKLNWGTSIVIAFALFMTFILFFVYTAETNSKYHNDLVVEEYYKHDAHFQEEMTKIQNAQDLIDKPTIVKTKEGIEVGFPKVYNPKNIIGKVSLYRSSNKKLDFEVPISTSSATLLIPKKSLVGGLWDITLSWKYENKEYLTKQTIYF
jgi:hypothetical protein